MASAWVGVVQLILLAAFVSAVFYLNSYRPAGTSYRPFRLKWWAPTLGACILFLLAVSLLHLPHYLQHTNSRVAKRHAEGRAECQRLLDEGATHAQRASLFGREWLRDEETAPPVKTSSTTVADVVSPLLNALLFNSGVTVCALPLLVHLAVLHLRRPAAQRAQDVFDTLRRESGVLLPVLNFISLVSAFTAPTFYLFIQPGRVDRCIYTSGHWFTFSVSLLTFAVIIAHLYSYQRYCKTSHEVMIWYVVWLGVYSMTALSVLKRTQEAFHDSTEAVDGIRQALPVYPLYMLAFLALQYVTFLSTEDAAEQPIQAIPAAVADSSSSSYPTAAAPPTSSLLSRAQVRQSELTSAPELTPQAPSAPPLSPPAAAANVPDAPPDAPPPPPPSAPSAPLKGLTQRKKAAPPPPPVQSARDATMNAIAAGVKLRPTQRGGRPAVEATGLNKWIQEARKVLEPDGEREDEDANGWEE